MIRRLKATGIRVLAKVIGVDLNRSVKFNGQSPFVVTYQFTNLMNGKVYVGKSDFIWFDPVASGHLKVGDDIPVLFNKTNPKENTALLDALHAAAA